MKFVAKAPSNIALIKYMGKLDFEKNIPTNPSLSFSLPHFFTQVEMEVVETDSCWEPLKVLGLLDPNLSEKGQARFLKHLNFLRNKFQVKENFKVKSASNFSSDCGLASSASSFAALTMCCEKAFKELGYDLASDMSFAQLSRLGSGSSCRSFYSPWALWSEDQVSSIELPYSDMTHEILMLDSKKKEVSSGDAHKRVFTSPNWNGRIERVQERLNLLIDSFIQRNWKKAYLITKEEFEDMHTLFETAVPSFSYRTELSRKVVHWIDESWEKTNDGPLVTMDAGPNIHLLFRAEQSAYKNKFLKELKEKIKG